MIAGHWLSSSTPPLLEQLEEVEKRIWLCYISEQTLLMSTASRCAWQVSICGEITFEDATKEFLFSNLPALNSSKYLRLEGFPNKDLASKCRLGAAEKEALNILIGNLLDGGYIHEASRVCRYFEFYNQDLSLVLHCRALASGEAQTTDFHPSIKILLTTDVALNGEMRHHRKRTPSCKLVYLSLLQLLQEAIWPIVFVPGSLKGQAQETANQNDLLEELGRFSSKCGGTGMADILILDP